MEQIQVGQLLKKENMITSPFEEETIDLELEKQKEYQRILKRCPFYLPPRFSGKTFENFNGFKDKVEAIECAIKNKQSVYIFGSCGTGKTHLAVASMYCAYIESAVIKQRDQLHTQSREYVSFIDDLRFLPSVEFFLKLKSTFNDNQETELEVINFYSNKTLLVIDDVGVEKVSDWSRQMFYTLIDRRYREMKQTIITSNMDLNKLAETIDERIASRIVEMGIVVKLEGKDLRVKK